MKKIIILTFLFLLAISAWPQNFTEALWVNTPNDENSSGKVRFSNGWWYSIYPEYKGFVLNPMKMNYFQKGNILYSYNTENEKYDIPEGKIKEETSTYIVITWYGVVLRDQKMYKVLHTVNLYYPSFENNGSLIKTFNP